MKTSDVVIAGGGIPGLALGCLLARNGLHVSIIEPSPPPRPEDIKPSARTAALMEGSLDILRDAGLWNKTLDDASTDLRNLAIVDPSQHAIFSAEEIGNERFGCNVVNGLLHAHAAQIFKDLSNAEIIRSSVQDFTVDLNAVTVTLENGDVISTPLLIGADGRNSIVRKIAGIAHHEHEYNQMAITALLSHTLSHEFTSTEFHRPGGPFTIVPMPGNTSSLVWIEPTESATRMLRLNKKDFEQKLQDLSHGLVGEITLLTAPEAWPLKLLSVKQVTGQRIALIAEAAHVLSPIGAQGLNLSLRDVRELADDIIEARSCGLDHGSATVLKKYERRRKTDVGLRVAGTHALNQMVATGNPFITSLRQLGLRAVSSIPPLRKLAMHEGFSPDHATASGRTTRAKVTTSTR